MGESRGIYKEKKLTPRQLRVIAHYMVHDNKKAALDSEGYHGPGYTHMFFRKPQVVAEIKRRQDRMVKKHELNEDWVIQRFMKIADANLGHILMKLQDSGYDLSTLTEDELYVIEQFSEEFYVEKEGDTVKKAKVSLPSKIQALIALGRRLGLFTDNLKLGADDDLAAAIRSGQTRAGKKVHEVGAKSDHEEE